MSVFKIIYELTRIYLELFTGCCQYQLHTFYNNIYEGYDRSQRRVYVMWFQKTPPWSWITMQPCIRLHSITAIFSSVCRITKQDLVPAVFLVWWRDRSCFSSLHTDLESMRSRGLHVLSLVCKDHNQGFPPLAATLYLETTSKRSPDSHILNIFSWEHVSLYSPHIPQVSILLSQL